MDFLEEVGMWTGLVLILSIVLVILLVFIKTLFGSFIHNKKIIDAPVGWFSLIGGISLALLALWFLIALVILIVKNVFLSKYIPL